MNIMKTNMLLLDNKIKKDDTESAVVTAPVPSETKPEQGMKALMFQGMQNLMANPKLAQGIGVMNDKMADNSSADSYVAPYSSNIAFQGGTKARSLVMAGLMALAATATLTSCNDKEYISVPASEYVNNVTVNVDLSQMTALVGLMQSTLTQMLLQQQLSYEQFQQYMEQMNAWQQQINARLANLETILTNMGENIIDIKNGVQENNAYQQLILGMLEQFMTRDEATALLNKLIAEVAAGNKTVAEAMQEIMEQLKLVNQNLTNILQAIKDADAKAQEDRANLLKVAQEINRNGKASLYQQQIMISQNMALIQQNNIIINNQKIIIAKIDEAALSINATIQEVADKLGMKVDDLAAVIVRTGKSLEEVMNMSKAEIVAAINANTAELQNTNNNLIDINNGIENNTITVEEAADEIIDLLNDIKATLSEFISMWKQKSDAEIAGIYNLNKLASQILGQQMFQSGMMVQLVNGMKDLERLHRETNAALKAIYDKIQGGGSLTAEEMELIAMRLNGNIQMSLGEIAALIKAELAKEDAQTALLAKINAKLSGLGAISNEILTEIQNLGDDLDGLDAINAKLDELIAAVKTISAQLDSYAKLAVNAHTQEMALLNGIKAELKNLGTKLNTLINQGKKAEIQRNNIENEIKNLKAQIAKLEAKIGRSITPQELDEILTEHDAANQAFYAELLSKFNVQPADFTTIEELLADIDAKMEYQAESNKILLDILEAVKKLDKTAPDYNEKLDKIIELMENFKFECNCQCDCDGNHDIHEGIIGIID